MTMRLGGNAPAVVLVALGIGLACEPIVGEPAPAAPINACPAYPCAAYTQPGPAPACNAGVCTVTASVPDLLLVIELATDSYLAPGRTYMTTLGRAGATPATCAPPDCCLLPDCTPPLCELPKWTEDVSSYLVNPFAAAQANWYLGAANMGMFTSLPVQATFRRLFGSPPQDALDLGLPVDPVQAVNFTTPPGNPGPDGTAQQQFRTDLQIGCYERTLQPFSPFSAAFPPEIEVWPWRSPPASPDPPFTISFDPTHEQTLSTGQTGSVPTFDIARAEGLDGWTVYLRNIQTKRIFSNVVALTGSLVQGVTLLTDHDPLEALTGLELALAPPAGEPMPTEVLAPIGAPPAQELSENAPSYPSLPTPITMTGRIETPADKPVPADLYFTAVDITNRLGQPFPPNFEFTTRVSTIIDGRTGASTYSALLPQGDYQIAVRPTDGANAVTVVSRSVGGQGNVMTGEDIDVTALVNLTGIATVADGRGLAEAIAEVLPTQCANAAAGAAPADSCLPRAAQTDTGSDGSFRLAVDPGQYLFRVRPRDGSGLPWKIQPIVVGTAALPLGKVMIPAPVSVGMQLTDTMPNPVANAIVRVFTDPSQGGPAIELGQAITDVHGNYQMYIAPPSQ